MLSKSIYLESNSYKIFIDVITEIIKIIHYSYQFSSQIGYFTYFNKKTIVLILYSIKQDPSFKCNFFHSFYKFIILIMQEDIILKICVVGNPGVGKTSLIQRYVNNNFSKHIQPSLGCNFITKIKTKKNKTLRMQLWDIAGQQRFQAVSKMYIRGAVGCLVISSADDKKSLDSTINWKKIIDQNCDMSIEQADPIPSILIQNKCDLVFEYNKQQFQRKEFLEKFAIENGFSGVCCTSAKNNDQITQCFQILLDNIIERNLISNHQNKKKSQLKQFSSKRKCC